MSVYTRFARVIQLIAGKVDYLIGGFDDKSAPTKFQITQASLTSNVVTYTGQVVAGNTPAVGQLMTVFGFANSVFNISDVAIASVTLDTSGTGTITVAVTHANIPAVVAGGTGCVLAPETSEATAASYTSQACGLSFSTPNGPRERTVTVQVTQPTAATTLKLSLQMSLRNVDSDYVYVGTGTTTAPATADFTQASSPAVKEYTLQNGMFYRLKATSDTTTDGTFIAKIVG